MNWAPVFFMRLRMLFHKQQMARELSEELASHLEMHTADNVRSGMTPEEARRDALIKLGGVEQTKEIYRELQGFYLLNSLHHDLRFGLRMLRKNAVVTAVVVLTLIIGIAAITTIFGIVNGILIRPFPAASPEEIVVLAIQEKDSPLGALGFSYPQFSEFRNEAGQLCEVFGLALAGPATFNAGNRTDQMALTAVSSNYFSAIGLRPALGRLILPGEGEAAGEAAVLVLGYSFWQSRFAGDPEIIGKSVRVNGIPVMIVGVLPKGFHGSFSLFEIDGYVPFSTIARDKDWNKLWADRNLRMILAMARLRKNVTVARAQAGLDVISTRVAAEHPATDKGVSVRVIPERLARPIPYANKAFIAIAVLFSALGGLILLLACTNVANILIARASIRQREMAIRTTLGATRRRLIGQMLIEALIIALTSGAGGIACSVLANKAIGSIHVAGFPVQLNYGLDWRVVLFALAAAIFSGICASLLPTLRSMGSDVNAALHIGGQNAASGGGRRRVHGDLMIVQIAGSLALLIVAGLFVRSLRSAENMYLGFNPVNLLNVTLNPQENNYDESRTNEFYRRLKEEVSAMPGVASVSMATFVPIESAPMKRTLYVQGRSLDQDRPPPTALYNQVDSGYFKTLAIPVLRGREFVEADDESAPPVAIINQTMANVFWPYEDPIGKQFSVKSRNGPFLEVIGVMQDGKYGTIGEGPQAYFCVPLAQDFASWRVIQIRSSLPSAALSDGIRQQIRALEPDMNILDLRTMKESLAGTKGFFTFRLAASLAGTMGILGLMMAVVGVYGVVSYKVTQRKREIGIRRALGASSKDIGKMIFGEGIRLVLVGVVVGILAAFLLTRLLLHMLVEVSASDPLTYASLSILLATVALLACYLPTRRAIRVEPLEALRHE